MKLEFTLTQEDIKNIRRIIDSKYNMLEKGFGKLFSLRVKKTNKENHITIEFEDEKIIYTNTRFKESTREIYFREIEKITCEEGYIFYSGIGNKGVYLCNENCFENENEKDEFLDFLNQKIGKNEEGKSLKDEKIISYKREYKDREKYIKGLISESKFENTKAFPSVVILISMICIILGVAFTGEIGFVIVFGFIAIIFSLYSFLATKTPMSRDLRIEIGDEQEVFERTITLDKAKNCITINSVLEDEKFNIADFLGIYAYMIVFRDKDSYKAFNLKDVANDSLEERFIMNFLEDNKYDNEKNRKVLKQVKTKFKLQFALLASGIVYVILGLSIVIFSAI
ncbi:MAG: hypothetical protein ACRDCW_18180 [Sarcina sp.]